MTVNIYTAFNGVGLERDYILLREILTDAGHEVNVSDWIKRQGCREGDVAFHLEIPRTGKCPPNLINLCKRNILIPNPEWFTKKWLGELNKFDEIWCKTQDCYNIFSKYHKNCIYTGFVSQDIYLPEISKERLFIHVAGNSLTKGTLSLVEAYIKKPDLPECFLISVNEWHCKGNLIHHNRLSWDDLKVLINNAYFNICTSEYEGWGHYLHEALSTKAVVISTDAAPMNEFITDKRLLLPQSGQIPMHMTERKLISSDSLIDKILELQQMPESELISIGELNRKQYLQRSNKFKKYLLKNI